MSGIVTLGCPTCGAKLQVTNDLDRFACGSCGNEHIVKRSGGIVSLKPVLDRLDQVRTGVDKTASELAIKRLTEEIAELEKELKTEKGRMTLPGCSGAAFCFVGTVALPAWLCSGFAREFLGITIVCLPIGFVLMNLDSKSETSIAAKARAKVIEGKIDEKRLQLAKHRESVNC